MERKDNFERAKNLLLGAVDTVIEIAKKKAASPTSDSVPSAANAPASYSLSPLSTASKPSTSGLSSGRPNSVLSEHKRLFGFKPSKPVRSNKSGKGKGKSRLNQPRGKVSSWKRECFCLSECEQTWKPSPEDKMKLAKMGLGLKEITFNSDGGEDHIHDTLLSTFPALSKCGGYTLLRLGAGSKGLMEIERPDDGMTVPYLKDILNQAKLYVRPLQCDLSEEDVKEFVDSSVSFSIVYIMW